MSGILELVLLGSNWKLKKTWFINRNSKKKILIFQPWQKSRGMPPRWPQLKGLPKKCVIDERNQFRPVTTAIIRKEVQLAAWLGLKDFYVELQWYQNFTKMFRWFVMNEVSKVSWRTIENVDEAPVPLNVVINQMMRRKEKDDVSISSTNQEKTNFIVTYQFWS